jgi:hypothetical protein
VNGNGLGLCAAGVKKIAQAVACVEDQVPSRSTVKLTGETARQCETVGL